MKKLKILFVVVTAFSCILNIQLQAKYKEKSSFTLKNVQILSFGESSNTKCYNLGTLSCPISSEKVANIVEWEW